MAGFAVLLGFSGCVSAPKQNIENIDATGDGIEDVVIYDDKNNKYFAFIGKEDGSYERATIKFDNGIPFYYTDSGFYNPWGQFIHNNVYQDF